MDVIRTLSEMSEYVSQVKKRGLRIGLVPTMGCLHAGHLSLVRLLDPVCDVKGASIFVNPLQFSAGEDFETYPRDEQRDLELLAEEGCSFVFSPSAGEMYPEGYQTYVDVSMLAEGLCGRYRKGHFQGVATVVLRLFNIIRPDVAAFGLKDYQQAALIRKMRDDLHLPVELVFGETIREDDGVAMSSRNTCLTPAERSQAAAIPRSIEWARKQVESGEKSTARLLEGMREILGREPALSIQYIEFVDPDTLEPQNTVNDAVQVMLAVYAGKTRLIDNARIGPGSEAKPIRGVSV